MVDFEVTMKKTSTKLHECHQLLQLNKIKKLEAHLKVFEERIKVIFKYFQELNKLKNKVQEVMLEKKKCIEHIEEWSSM